MGWGNDSRWDLTVPILGSVWGHPSIGIHRFPFMWGHPSIGIRPFQFPCPYGDIHQLGSVSSHFRVCLGTSIH